jgi:NTP pyrophosphatase (non-canonical NTP hydrolase)
MGVRQWGKEKGQKDKQRNFQQYFSYIVEETEVLGEYHRPVASH